MNQGSSGPYLGVDIGGTKIAVGVVDKEGKILVQSRSPMVANGTAEAGLRRGRSCDPFHNRDDAGGKVQGIGICAPGPLDPQTGVVLNPPNVPCWRNFPLAARIGAKYRVPVKVDNDANAAALAETRWGAARGYKYVFYATIGTGIGTGIVFDGPYITEVADQPGKAATSASIIRDRPVDVASVDASRSSRRDRRLRNGRARNSQPILRYTPRFSTSPTAISDRSRARKWHRRTSQEISPPVKFSQKHPTFSLHGWVTSLIYSIQTSSSSAGVLQACSGHSLTTSNSIFRSGASIQTPFRFRS